MAYQSLNQENHMNGIQSFNSVSEEIQMESSNMNIINNGNTILADNAEINLLTKNLKIYMNNNKKVKK